MKKSSVDVVKQILEGMKIEQLLPNSLVVLHLDSKVIMILQDVIQEFQQELKKVCPTITVVTICSSDNIKTALEYVSEEQMNSFGWYSKT